MPPLEYHPNKEGLAQLEADGCDFVETLAQRLTDRQRHHVEARDFNSAWNAWVQTAEEYLGRAEILGAVPLQSRGQPGRSCPPVFKQQQVTAPGRRAYPTDGAASLILTRLQQILDLATEMWQQSRRHAQIWPPTCDQLSHVWTTWHRLLQTGPQHAADQEFWQQFQFAPVSPRPKASPRFAFGSAPN